MSKGKFNHIPSKSKIQTINISDLASLSLKDIDKKTLYENNLIKHTKYPVKVLGNGNLKVKLNIQAAAFTNSAKSKIEAAGGTCETFDYKKVD